ncbi:hypothetical protein AMIS_51600 [Actinoplanes missouriensis 431]|uniref:Uncharacterized protein n=1 Tax=Actinoplanes missouriensis (strain ATCC 14538 / DSM 43046 / CBS 188.64 / JCM 3121 / NBRC 102363 / NCIMB 12654 / NRRL B-3342 / UNCC 431) TaxID=512565 RepID=I0HBJ3_ACTM4|nr:hypothetical protein [Actinoplanes missouriensis]BAL90380.1 hypothetical protein AMIS_51600 [Actinoplanes missouriensis 431]
MTPQEARRRAEQVLQQQTSGAQVIELNSDGSLKMSKAHSPLAQKSTVLHDPYGEYA